MKDHSSYMQLALEEAKQAALAGEVPVGAVLVLEDGQVFKARNAPITLSDPSAHAEMLVIREATKHVGNYRLTGSTLYVSLEPCLMCAGLLLQARVQTLVYAAPEPKTGAVHSLYQVLDDTRLNHQVEVITPLLAEQSSSLLRCFFKERRAKHKKDKLLRHLK
ncbi:MAG: tRNA adenosine(34) deaminase TadA [Mariprofundaceae bacterium]|nr:tRNA adenosine(34) deaminase TadA [Mariprofundaceae bacterium]